MRVDGDLMETLHAAVKDPEVGLVATGLLLAAGARIVELENALRHATVVADEAAREWDKAPSGMRSGKLLNALAGGIPRYRADIDLIHAVLDRNSRPGGREVYRHKKRGEVVHVIGGAYLQTAQPVGDMTPLTVYRADDGSLWARPGLEFADGRFERVDP